MHARRHRDDVRGGLVGGHFRTGASSVVPSCVFVLMVTLLLTAAAPPTAAQGPEGYGVPHLFALPTATTTRLFGMGGVTTCVEDRGFANPAFAGMLEQQQALMRVSRTSFDGGLKLTGTHASYALPIGREQGMQFVGFRLDSDRGTIMTPAGGLPGTIEETDAAVHYGRRISEQWLAGIGVAPILEAKTRLRHPATGDVVSFSDSKANFGFRIGGLYQFDDEGFAGFVFDWYTEDVTFQAPPMPAPETFDFTSTEWALGVSGRLTENLLGAIEWMELKSRNGGARAKSEGLHLGVEYEATPAVALRAGCNDGGLSLGAGYSRDGWVFNYAYINDWNDDSVGQAFGGSDTHQLEVSHSW